MNFNSFLCAFDLGEMFLNFPLEFSMRKYSGVRLKTIKKLIEKEGHDYVVTQDETWTRMFMGFFPSPFVCIKFFYLIKELVIGNHEKKGSPVRWDKVVLNLPGRKNFDPRLPWVYWWDEE